MDIIRSKLNVKGFVDGNWFDYIIDIFKHEKVLSTWKKYEIDDSDTDNKIATFYINDDVYIEMTCTPSKFSIELYSYGYTNNIHNTTNNINSYISCITIYKQNTCTGFSLKFSSSDNGSYSSLDIPIVIDSINNDPNNIVVLYPSSTPRFYTSTSDGSITSYWYYKDLSTSGTNTIQLVPFVISKIDAQFDTLYGVCFSPVMNKFVMFNNERWLITGQGIAIPCGDEINYYYVD